MTKQRLFYSPEENHIAIICSGFCRQKRFKGFATEKEHIWLGPRRLTHRFVFKEINLGPRTAHILLSNVLTVDQVHLELELKVFYRVDPRDTAPENLIQVLKMPNAGFESIVRTNTEEKVRNEIFVQKTADKLFSYHGRRDLRKMLSNRISERVRGFGITVNPLFGAVILNMQPNAIYKQAMQEASAAKAQDLASIRRLAASLDAMPKLTSEQAEQILYLQMASAVNKTGNIPQAIYTQHNNESPAPTQGLPSVNANQPEGPQPKKVKPEHKYPIAAD